MCHIFFQLLSIFPGGDGVVLFIKLRHQFHAKTFCISIRLIAIFMLQKALRRFFSRLPHIKETIAQQKFGVFFPEFYKFANLFIQFYDIEVILQCRKRNLMLSEWRESNPRVQLGKLAFYHWTTLAFSSIKLSHNCIL